MNQNLTRLQQRDDRIVALEGALNLLIGSARWLLDGLEPPHHADALDAENRRRLDTLRQSTNEALAVLTAR